MSLEIPIMVLQGNSTVRVSYLGTLESRTMPRIQAHSWLPGDTGLIAQVLRAYEKLIHNSGCIQQY